MKQSRTGLYPTRGQQRGIVEPTAMGGHEDIFHPGALRRRNERKEVLLRHQVGFFLAYHPAGNALLLPDGCLAQSRSHVVVHVLHIHSPAQLLAAACNAFGALRHCLELRHRCNQLLAHAPASTTRATNGDEEEMLALLQQRAREIEVVESAWRAKVLRFADSGQPLWPRACRRAAAIARQSEAALFSRPRLCPPPLPSARRARGPLH